MDDKKRNEINSLMIQSYFDGELNSDELEAVSHEDLVHSEMYEAMDELRRVVRVESSLALDDIDGYALLDAINQELDNETNQKQVFIQPLSQPKRRTSKQFFQRWAPALIGAALFLLSIPGLIHWVATSKTSEVQPQTVVVIDSNSAQHNPGIVNYQNPDKGTWFEPSPAKNAQNNQLTVEEMDIAIRHLIQRIETLEEANTHEIESGTRGLGNVPEGPQNQL